MVRWMVTAPAHELRFWTARVGGRWRRVSSDAGGRLLAEGRVVVRLYIWTGDLTVFQYDPRRPLTTRPTFTPGDAPKVARAALPFAEP